MNNIEISDSPQWEKVVIEGGEKTIARLQEAFPQLPVFPWRTFKIGINAGKVASVAIALDGETFKRFQKAVAEAKQNGVWVSYPDNDGETWEGKDNHIWTMNYDYLSDVINILKSAIQ